MAGKFQGRKAGSGLCLLLAGLLMASAVSGCAGSSELDVSGNPTGPAGSVGYTTSPSGMGDPSQTGGTQVPGDETGIGSEETQAVSNGGGQTRKPDGQGSGDKDSSTPGVTPPSSSSKNEVVTKGSLKLNTVDFPIVKEGNYEMTVILCGDTLADYSKKGFTKEYEELTGIKVNYKPYNSGDVFVVKATAIQSGNTPDVFAAVPIGFNNAELENLAKDGVTLELSSYMDKWAPNAVAAIKKSQRATTYTYQSDGKVYGLPSINNYETSVGGAEERQLMINKYWLDELGLEIPETTDEFYQVLKAFVTQDPNGNGKNDEQGFGINLWTPQIWNPWGLNMNWYMNGSIDEKGVVHMGTMTEQFREGIRFWKKCWDEKLICKEAIGASGAALNAQLKKCGIVSYPNMQNVVGENEYENWVPMSWPKGSNTGDFLPGVTECNGKTGDSDAFPNKFVVFKSTKCPEATMRWLDYFYTQDGGMLAYYGPEGGVYTKIGNNYKLIKDYGSKVGQYNLTSVWGGIGGGALNILPRNTAEMSVTERWVAERDKACAEMRKSRMPKYAFRLLYEMRTSSEMAALDKLGQIGDFNWGYQAIRGEVNVETDWNAYITQYSKNYEQWKKIYQGIFKRVYG